MDITIIMNNIINFLKMFVLISFVMYVTRGIIKNKHVRTKGLVYSLVAFFFLIVGIIAFFVDRAMDTQLNENPLLYIYFIASALIYLIYGIIRFIKAQKLSRPVHKKMVYTYHLKNEYVYVVFKHTSLIYLQKDSNVGIKIGLKKTEFADDIVTQLCQKLNIKINDDSINRLGTCTHKGEKYDDVYYCYMIEVDDPINDNKLIWFNSYDITSINIPDIDRFIILKLLMNKNFDEIF